MNTQWAYLYICIKCVNYQKHAIEWRDFLGTSAASLLNHEWIWRVDYVPNGTLKKWSSVSTRDLFCAVQLSNTAFHLCRYWMMHLSSDHSQVIVSHGWQSGKRNRRMAQRPSEQLSLTAVRRRASDAEWAVRHSRWRFNKRRDTFRPESKIHWSVGRRVFDMGGGVADSLTERGMFCWCQRRWQLLLWSAFSIVHMWHAQHHRQWRYRSNRGIGRINEMTFMTSLTFLVLLLLL